MPNTKQPEQNKVRLNLKDGTNIVFNPKNKSYNTLIKYDKPEQNKTWIDKFDNETFLDCNDDVVDDEYLLDQIKDFIKNLLKEHTDQHLTMLLERVNKEVIGGDEKLIKAKFNSIQQIRNIKPIHRNELRQEQRQKLDLIKGEVK